MPKLDRLKFIGINISGNVPADEHFLAFIDVHLNGMGIPVGILCFEITGTAAMADPEAADQCSTLLNKHDRRCASDNFGVGLWCVACLKTEAMFMCDRAEDTVDRCLEKYMHDTGFMTGMKTVVRFLEQGDSVVRPGKWVSIIFRVMTCTSRNP